MKRKDLQSYVKRGAAFLLSFAVGISGITYTPAGKMTAEAAGDVIKIATAEELAKIGKEAAYPMNGDYVLTKDIDLEGMKWTPIGGSSGPEYGLVEGERVFNGTLDGAGHAIRNLTIDYNGSVSGQATNQTGLFAFIASDNAGDYAEVKNLVFTDVNIKHTLGRGDSIGTLAADVNGYAKIDNVAVAGGSISVESVASSDLIGAGGIVGQSRTNSSAVQLTNLYQAADVTVSGDNRVSGQRTGGIIGRIHQSGYIGNMSSCLNIGNVKSFGDSGYAVNGVSQTIDAEANTKNIHNCYYLEKTGVGNRAVTQVSKQGLSEEALIASLGDSWELKAEKGAILKLMEGKIVIPIPSPVFAEGENASSVTRNFTVPVSYTGETGTEAITWVSSNPNVITIDNTAGTATVHGVLADTKVTLTATTAGGRTKTVTVTVRSDLILELSQEYAKPGVEMQASVAKAPEGTSFTYTWDVEGKEVATGASYTPKTTDVNKFISITAKLNGVPAASTRLYCSNLPVVYINTDDGYDITSKTEYKGASMRIQGNERYNSKNTTLYEGKTEIRGRGNSTWSGGQNKKPYKLKLDKKTDLFGFGESKHWTLLANYMDESLMRNWISYDLSGAMGMVYLPSASVELILNDTYVGSYQLVGNVRIEESRADIFDWEDCAEDVAKAVAKKHGMTADERDLLEAYANENLSWATDPKGFTYKGTTYPRADYESALPKDASGNVDISGGFLYELDEYYDEISRFRTTANQPIMFKSPEFISPDKGGYNNSPELADFAKNYIQTVENSFQSEDYYVSYQGEKKHYTDLVDLDSLVRYFVLNEFFWNTETMKKSSYMYKDLGGKLMIGPVWDMDWTSNSLISQNETGNPRVWMTNARGAGAQSQQWYKSLIGDPYFIAKVYECYKENRENFEKIVKPGGIIDQNKTYLAESAKANYEHGYVHNMGDADAEFNRAAERLRTFLKERISWMDTQMADVNTLVNSFKTYKGYDVTVTADVSGAKTTSYKAKVAEAAAKKVGFYINGILAGTANIVGGEASFTASDSFLVSGKTNVIQARAMDAAGKLLYGVNGYAVFTKTVQVDNLTGTVTVTGKPKVGEVLTAAVADTNNTGTLTWQWLADGVKIEGASEKTLLLTKALAGKKISVQVGSTVEAGKIVSAETAAVEATELKNDHVIINQVYGGGANEDSAVSHSFIELYNPTEKEMDLTGYSLGYLSNGKNGTAAAEVKLALDGKIPAGCSYLVRCEAQTLVANTEFYYTIPDNGYDKSWEQTIDNKQFRIVLYKADKTKADAVSVGEENVEGPAIADGVSKQKSIRRKDFADTDVNQEDFEIIDYREDSAANYPRSLKDGPWKNGDVPTPSDQELTGSVSVRGNAVVGAHLYIDTAKVTDDKVLEGTYSYQWFADGGEIAGAAGAFLTLDEKYNGKKISVKLTSSERKGNLTGELTDSVKAPAVQKEHLIIHQVYGCGTKDGAVSHSFIELYNPTEKAVDLTGYSILYTSDGASETGELSGEVPAHTSWLIRRAAGKPDSVILNLEKADTEWDLEIDNKQYSVVLQKDGARIDGVSVNEAEVEGTALTNPAGDEIISKNKAIRRIGFMDSDVNVNDFEVLNYSKLPEDVIEEVKPRSTADGVWGMAPVEPDLDKPTEEQKKELAEELQSSDTLLGESAKYTEDSYAAFKEAYDEAKRLSMDPSATADQIRQALAALKAARENLKTVSVETPPVETPPVETPPTETPPAVELPKKGAVYKDSKGIYKVTKSAAKDGTVTFVKPKKKTNKSFVIPASVKIDGITFKVTAIADKAFQGNKKLTAVTIGANVKTIGKSAFEGDAKLKKITVKTLVLKKAGKNAFKGIHAKCRIKVSKKKLKSYSKILSGKGQKSGVKITK